MAHKGNFHNTNNMNKKRPCFFHEFGQHYKRLYKDGKKDTLDGEHDDGDYQKQGKEHLEYDDVEIFRKESQQRRQTILDKYKQQQNAEVDETLEAITTDNNSSTRSNAISKNISSENNVNDTLSRVEALELSSQKSKPTKSNDTFSNDMFVESPMDGWKIERGVGLAINSIGLEDKWDDHEGRYRFQLREVLDGRYHILASLGSGVFSSVVKACDSKGCRDDSNDVAIKIIRNNHIMYKSGLGEVAILKKLAKVDVEDKRHCVRLLSSFEHRNHLCLVFENLDMNLRNVLNKYGRNIGINLIAIQAYARQILVALKHLWNCQVLHCDIKPDNILVNNPTNVRKSKLKLCDFGSAMFLGTNEITPYLVSRYYRAPEIILGLPYGHALDMWSVACCLYELYSGQILFRGNSNNQMLQLQMELMGVFPKKMLKRAQFKNHHFDQGLKFSMVEEDLVTKKLVKKIISNERIAKSADMKHLITSIGGAREDPRLVAQFTDLLEKMLALDPSKRMTVVEALEHPFILNNDTIKFIS